MFSVLFFSEQLLESKLTMLESLVIQANETSVNGWHTMVKEETLLSRIQTLEAQLQVYAKVIH